MQFKHDFIKIEKERFVTFMDALMAIVMTIMVLEIKIPAVENLSDEALRHELRKSITPLIGFLVSFGSLVMIWIDHHDLMKDIEGVTKQFALLNFILILVIALVPFSTALAWGYPKDSLPVFIYALNLFMVSFVFTILYVFADAKKLLADSRHQSQYSKVKMVMGISGGILLLIAMPIAYLNPGASLLLTALVPLAHTIPIIFSYKFKN